MTQNECIILKCAAFTILASLFDLMIFFKMSRYNPEVYNWSFKPVLM